MIRVTDEERKSILENHRQLFQKQVMIQKNDNLTPLEVKDFAKDKGGVTVKGDGSVQSYTNHIKESKQIKEGLYGDASDVVDYDLPEFLSDSIILQKIESWSDVEKSLKELHKRLIRLEKGLDHAGSHNKAYGTGTDYSAKNKRDVGFEKSIDSIERDEQLRQDIEQLKKDLEI